MFIDSDEEDDDDDEGFSSPQKKARPFKIDDDDKWVRYQPTGAPYWSGWTQAQSTFDVSFAGVVRLR